MNTSPLGARFQLFCAASRGIAVFLWIAIFSAPAVASELRVVPQGPAGVCSVEQWKKDWPGCPWGDGVKDGRLVIGERQGVKTFRVNYAVGRIGPEQGGVGWRYPVSAAEEAELTYCVRFSEGFEWVKGGKLPGLCGGPENVSGGKRADGTNGFSVRLMWRAEGRGEAYVYHRNQRSNYGDSFAFPEDFRFSRNTPVRVRMRVAMNDPGRKNGRLGVWIGMGNGPERQVVDKTEMEWRSVETIQVDAVMFETFYGGGDGSWAPTNACSTEFSEIALEF
jgi:hypothetical protein